MEPEDGPPFDLEEPENGRPSLADALQSLPLLEEDMYLRMQGLTLAIVDDLLEGLEQQLLSEYLERESTPIQTAMLVLGTSQLWVFGVYELMRTWRQRARQVLKFEEEMSGLSREQQEVRITAQKERISRLSANPAHSLPFERAARDSGYASRLRSAVERSELPFRKLEALRLYLAKHEVPRVKGSFGMSPGSARIDTATGSVNWEIELGEMEVDALSRREVANSLRMLATDFPLYILPEPVQRQLAKLPRENYYNLRPVRLVLDDSTEHVALVAFDRQVLCGTGLLRLPYDVKRVVGWRPRSAPEASTNDNLEPAR